MDRGWTERTIHPGLDRGRNLFSCSRAFESPGSSCPRVEASVIGFIISRQIARALVDQGIDLRDQDPESPLMRPSPIKDVVILGKGTAGG